MARVFISYAGPDFRIAKSVDRLLTAAGHDVYFAPRVLRAGDSIAAELEREIRTRDAFVLIATQNVVQRAYVQAEVALAFSHRKRMLVLKRVDYVGDVEIDFRTKAAVWVNCGGSVTDRDVHSVENGLDQLSHKQKIVVATLNLKGGTGKTTVCGNVFAAISEIRPQPVLMVDLDPQHNLTQMLLRSARADAAREADRSVISLFEPSQISDPVCETPKDRLTIRTEEERSTVAWDALIETPQLRAGPSVSLVVGQFEAAKYSLSRDGDAIDKALARFKDCVSQLSDFFPIIAIDVNPSASAFTDAALSVATHIVTPIMPNPHSYAGAKLLCEFLRMRDQEHLISRIIPVLTGFQANRIPGAQIQLMDAIRDDIHFGQRTLSVGISHSGYLVPRNDDPQGLGYLRNSAVGTNVRTVANLLLEELRSDALPQAADTAERRASTG
jgi:cellulose biosynthesis protein BcsQ